MARKKAKAAKKSLLRHVRKQRLKYIAILPSLVTLINGACGFLAIVMASKGRRVQADEFSYFAVSAYLIFLAMIADMLDGRLARMSKNTSSFGGQLDSLCDVISFGVAPAFLMVEILGSKLSSAGFADDHSLTRFVWFAAAVYMSCAIIRLARFNVENEEDESAHMSFIGLPSPAAAGVVASVVLFHEETLPSFDVTLYLIPLLAIGAGVLMVSRLRYPHVLNQYLKGKKPFAYLIRILFLLGLVAVSDVRQTATVLFFCGFASSSAVKWLYRKIPSKRESFPEAVANLESSD
jgi:CDP-diacylglycerol--serine O-phosphatidyltransferase